MRRFAATPYRIDMINEDCYTSRSADNVRAYAHECALRLAWNARADEATVFGIHATTGKDALIIHGELEVSRLTLGGESVWSAGGADIFTGELRIEGDRVRVYDLDGHEYQFDIVSGSHPAP